MWQYAPRAAEKRQCVATFEPWVFQSKLCDVEARLAVQLSYDLNFDLKIIPVLVQDLNADTELPLFLQPFACIDALREVDCSAQIKDAFYKSGIIVISKKFSGKEIDIY